MYSLRRLLPLLTFCVTAACRAQSSQDSLAAFHQVLWMWDGPGIDRLIKSGVDINGVVGNFSAMGVVANGASSLRDTQMMNHIGYKGGDIDRGGAAGTPLYLVASKQYIDGAVQVALIDWMVRHGARVQPADGAGSSPLTGALTYANKAAALYLVRRGATVEPWHLALAAEQFNRSRAATQKAVGWRDEMALLDTLIALPFSVVAQSRNYTALGHAILHGDTSLVRVLLARKPKLEAATEGAEHQFCPIHLAAWKYPLDPYTPERLAILTVLIAAGSEKAARTPREYTSTVTHTRNSTIPAGSNVRDVAIRSGATPASHYLRQLGT